MFNSNKRITKAALSKMDPFPVGYTTSGPVCGPFALAFMFQVHPKQLLTYIKCRQRRDPRWRGSMIEDELLEMSRDICNPEMHEFNVPVSALRFCEDYTRPSQRYIAVTCDHFFGVFTINGQRYAVDQNGGVKPAQDHWFRRCRVTHSITLVPKRGQRMPELDAHVNSL